MFNPIRFLFSCFHLQRDLNMKFSRKSILCTSIISHGCCSRLITQDTVPEPTAGHKIVAREAGIWSGDMKMYLNGPDADPITMQVVKKNVIMDTELWLISDFESDPFKGHTLFGYDAAKQK